MDFKVKVKCSKCLCVFELRPKHLSSEKKFACPCCRTPFSDQLNDNVLHGMEAFSHLPGNEQNDGEFAPLKKFPFTFAIEPFQDVRDPLSIFDCPSHE